MKKEQNVVLVAELAAELHRCGAPAHRLELAVEGLLAAYGAQGAVVASPTALWLQVGEVARVLRLRPGEVEFSRLGRLTDLRAWQARVAAERPPIARARSSLRAIREAPSLWSPAARAVAFVAACATAGALIGGTWNDALAAAVGGEAVRRLLAAVGRRPGWAPLGDGLAALAAGALGGLSAAAGAAPAAASLGAVIVLLPGLSLTVAATEVAIGQWSSGGARLLGVGACLLQLAAGLAGGLALTAGVPALLPVAALPGWAAAAAPIVAPATFAALAGLRPRESLAVIWLGALGYLVAGALDGLAGTAAGALVVGFGASALERAQGMPALVLLVPGILLLVPGSVGLRGVDLLLEGAVVEGLGVALQALGTAATLAAAVLAAGALADGGRPTPGLQDRSPGALKTRVAAGAAGAARR